MGPEHDTSGAPICSEISSTFAWGRSVALELRVEGNFPPLRGNQLDFQSSHGVLHLTNVFLVHRVLMLMRKSLGTLKHERERRYRGKAYGDGVKATMAGWGNWKLLAEALHIGGLDMMVLFC